LGQVKELKDTKALVDDTAQRMRAMEERIARLERQNRQLNYYVEALRNHLSKK
jgi:chaperonin cofactor prefoldin